MAAESVSAFEDPNVAVYEQSATDWEKVRMPADFKVAQDFAQFAVTTARGQDTEVASRLDAETASDICLDLGCGPGWYTSHLPQPAIALDATLAMLKLVPKWSPDAPRVAADLRALPFLRGCVTSAWASKSYLHLRKTETPMALADLHRVLKVGATVDFSFLHGDVEYDELQSDDFPGRYFSMWESEHLRDVLVGAGFEVLSMEHQPDARARQGWGMIQVRAKRAFSLPDTVGTEMMLLICGLNPSPMAAETGVGFAHPSNRFWKAALAAGIVSHDRDPVHALRHHNVGMTDLVKRTTRRADEISPQEFQEGIARVERLVRWLKPETICFVGLAGYRAAIDPKAKPGFQPNKIGQTPVYLMPSTSGAAATITQNSLTTHLAAASKPRMAP